MSVTRHDIRRGAYYDSVVLMQLQRGLLGLPGVVDAGVVMATPANRELLAANALLGESMDANPDDLLIVVKAETEAAAAGALEQVDALLARRRSSAAADDFRPRSLAAAARLLPEAGWALVSVPGRYAAAVAREALDLGKHVFLYSDNVSLADEIDLKQTACGRGLLVMGPDCGTALIGGIGLGFANRVRRGPIGLVGASGTGLQAITARVHSLGSGVSHAIGTGGRDLKAEVGALTAHQALDVLRRDPETRVIVLVSKPPSPDVAAGLLAAAGSAGKPVVVDFIGHPSPARRLGNLHFATTLSEAAELAVALLESPAETVDRRPALTGRFLRGLFSGGTLAYEAMLGLQSFLSPLYSNAPIRPEQALDDPLHSSAHTIVDLGGDEFTVGRLHPMIDNDLRLRRLRQEADDPQTGLILLDVVLGQGAHPDPASELAPGVQDVVARGLEAVVIAVGTQEDPQGLESQIERFQQAGASVFRTVNDAVAYVRLRFESAPPAPAAPVSLEQLGRPLAAINLGLESFYESLVAQGASAVHVEWRPPAGGNEKLASLLARMKK
jgi:FdrA protein